MLKVISSKKGPPTLINNSTYLHSRYDPEKEAFRFIKNIINTSSPSCIIVLGAGIGYLIKAINELFPDSVIISIFYSEFISFS